MRHKDNKLTAAEVTEDLEKSLSASLNFLFLLSALLFVFLEVEEEKSFDFGRTHISTNFNQTKLQLACV